MLGGGHTLHFFDAAAPLVTFDSVDMDSAWFASRYDKGTAGLHQLPHDQGGVSGLLGGAGARPRRPRSTALRTASVFEGCMPVEVMARRGEDTLRYGPLKPRGLVDPQDRAVSPTPWCSCGGTTPTAPSTIWWAFRPT